MIEFLCDDGQWSTLPAELLSTRLFFSGWKLKNQPFNLFVHAQAVKAGIGCHVHPFVCKRLGGYFNEFVFAALCLCCTQTA